MKRLLLALVLLGVLGMAQAKSLDAVILLHSIKMIESTEQYGDQLYFMAAEYHGSEPGRRYTVPKPHAFWSADHLNKVKNVTLWHDKLEEGESVTLVFQLLERDIAPFDVDEPVGTAQVKLQNVKGKLAIEWHTLRDLSLVPLAKTPGKLNRHEKIVFRGAGGVYNLDFVAALNYTKPSVPWVKPSSKQSVSTGAAAH